MFPEGSAFTISGLTQKVNVLGENLMIAWAGTRYIAKEILTELNDRICTKPLTVETLRGYFEDFSRSKNRNDVHFVGTLLDGGQVLSFTIGGEVVNDRIWGEVRLAGTGADDAKLFLQHSEAPKLVTAGPARPMLEGIGRSLMLTAHLIQLELQSHSSLLQFYGAGYEIASFVDGRFAKIADVTYLFWEADATGGRVQLSQPYYMVRYSYRNGVLGMRSSRLSGQRKDGVPLFDESTHLVEPAFRSISEQDVEAFRATPVNMNSRFLVNLFLVRYRDESIEWMSRVDYRATPNTHVVFHELPEGLGLAIEHRFIEAVLAALQQRIDSQSRDTG